MLHRSRFADITTDLVGRRRRFVHVDPEGFELNFDHEPNTEEIPTITIWSSDDDLFEHTLTYRRGFNEEIVPPPGAGWFYVGKNAVSSRWSRLARTSSRSLSTVSIEER
jgi:hypothetical protein